jgi:hypothetical protein
MATGRATLTRNVLTGECHTASSPKEFLDQAYLRDKILLEESCETPWSAGACSRFSSCDTNFSVLALPQQPKNMSFRMKHL